MNLERLHDPKGSGDSPRSQEPALPFSSKWNFEELSAQRRLLQGFCSHHLSSILMFRRKRGLGFELHVDENQKKRSRRKRVHLTTTATCIESILGCPEHYRVDSDYNLEREAKMFASTAIQLDGNKEWKSEDSAHIYCRCRGLPVTIEHLEHYDKRLGDHVKRIMRQLRYDPTRFSIGEADVADESSPEKIDKARRAWYPPNAFHTFWTLEILKRFEDRFSSHYRTLESDLRRGLKLELPKVIDGMLLWSQRTLGYQVSLHAADSSVLDSDQLAWSLATLLKFAKSFPTDLAEQDLLREALKQLFKTQLPIGTWGHYRALFHYKAVGNAYCYVYETFAALLGIALDGDASRRFFRDALTPYIDNLTKLWRYAESTRVAMTAEETDEPSAMGWSSGHRLNQTKPESWATASVFAFAQAFRKLLGVWTRELARKELNVVPPVFDKDVEKVLAEQGNTWTEKNETTVAERLYTMFVNPVLLHDHKDMEPDRQPIQPQQARSAILFGPPGTGKTTLCGAVAKAIGWDYIELHASHFVADGLQNVQKRADAVFQRLMEIDHAVVLFDEIDELVRERESEHDAFGRFLTTSMLPKVAELWKQRKVIYFVATNHIRYFDAAITRSRRFDALILVSPPSYAIKMRRLLALLRETGCEATFPNMRDQMWSALVRAGKIEDWKKPDSVRSQTLADDLTLAKYVLLRWDQMDELASRLKSISPDRVTRKDLVTALKKINDRRLLVRAPYIDFFNDVRYPTRDFGIELAWKASGFDREYEPDIVERDGGYWLTVHRSDAPPSEIHGFQLVESGISTVHYEKKARLKKKTARKGSRP